MVMVNGSKNGAKTEKRGGFKVPDKTAIVRFEGTDYDGAEIVLRLNVSLEHYLDLLDLQNLPLLYLELRLLILAKHILLP